MQIRDSRKLKEKGYYQIKTFMSTYEDRQTTDINYFLRTLKSNEILISVERLQYTNELLTTIVFFISELRKEERE